MRILVVEDAPECAHVLMEGLRQAGFTVDLAENGHRALELARATEPDVILLDLILPGMSGLDVCRELRTFCNAHMIMTTGKSEEFDRVVGLSVGADDYVTKPYSVPELVARVRAVQRRRTSMITPQTVRRVGPVEIDRQARTVTVNGGRVELTRIEFELLDAIAGRPRMVWTRAAIIDAVWTGGEDRPSDLVIDTHVKNLRRKIDRPGFDSTITTVRGVGYRFNQDLVGLSGERVSAAG
jgi:DNA-binding response OmpR family regulator